MLNETLAETASRQMLMPKAITGPGDRILFLIDEMSAITAGGTERQLLQLVGIARRNGLQPAICVLRGTKWLTPEIAGCPVAHFDISSIRTAGGVASLGKLARWMRSRQFAILQTFFSESNLIGPWIAKLAGIPVVLGTRRNLSHHIEEAPARAALRMQWLSNLLVDEILVNSHAVRRNTAGNEWLSAGKLRVVYNGIDLSRMQPRPGAREQMRRQLGVAEDDLLVGNISGLRAIKGVLQFVEAAALSRSREPRLKFVLVGEGEMRPALEAAIARNSLGSAFCLAGAAEDVLPFLAAMDVAVLCSLAEGLSNSLLEYMAAGLPTIATEVGGNREALGDAGVLIPPEDPRMLRDALLTMMNADVRKNYSVKAIEEVKKFDVRNADREMGDVFRRHLSMAFASKRNRART